MATKRRSANLPMLCGILCVLAPRMALGAERACPAIDLQADASFNARWPDLVVDIRRELSDRDDIDSCASVALSLQPDTTIRITAALPDGRSATRSALRREDVIPTLQALLLVPEPAPAVATVPESATPARKPPRTRPRLRASERPVADDIDAGTSSSAARAAALGLELSLISGARIGDGQASFALGALSFLDFAGWLVGFQGRADEYRSLAGGPPETALELGVLLGKRLSFSNVTLDLVAGPAVALKGAVSDTEMVVTNSADMPPTAPPPPLRRERESGPVPRVLTGVRLGFSPRSVVRGFVGADATFGPRLPANSNSGPSRLPLWALGLTVGVTVGTR